MQVQDSLTRTGSGGRIKAPLFDLGHTVESGCPLTFFSDYDKEANSVRYVSGGRVITASHRAGIIRFSCGDIRFGKRDIERRFRLADDLGRIYKGINTDRHVDASIRRFRGMRVTLNDPWETTLCFIISQFNNVKRIRLIVKSIIERYGTPIIDTDGNEIAKSFPKSESLVGATAKELLACGTGFRAKYIIHAAEYCTNNLDLYGLNPGKYEMLKEKLMEINGVGDKVADCIALMGYGNLEAFPIDVHIKRAMERLYFNGKKTKLKDIHEISRSMWGDYRGYANQYLFHTERTA